MPNRLIDENSPYLIQHAQNPVDWYPWGTEALEKARREDRPIFLSIGYAACHWCHVMAHESFENAETADLMNLHFVNIKVDREERPDLDGIYMDAVVAMSGQGGWPMSVFLTPEGVPFYGGTYFPPVPRYNMPSFRDLLLSISHAWQENRAELMSRGQELVRHLQAAAAPPGEGVNPDGAYLDRAAMSLAQQYDWRLGGWGRAPKFPQPMAIEYLLNKSTRGDSLALEIASHALDKMSAGGMYDIVGGGFARYSTDDRWLVPHFEKMLYDNAQLAVAYLHGYVITHKKPWLDVVQKTLAFIERELTHPSGGFFSSLDADSEGEEGRYYSWGYDELKQVLGKETFAVFQDLFDLRQEGNFEGKIVLQQQKSIGEVARERGFDVMEIASRLESGLDLLLAARSLRVRPATDDKILTAWNGLMLYTVAEAARYLDNSHYLEVAQRNAGFLLREMVTPTRVFRSWREGTTGISGFLEDYAALMLGLLALYQADGDPRWYQASVNLAERMVDQFSDPVGGFFDTARSSDPLIVRPKGIQDNAVPSGNALAAKALLQLAALSGESKWLEIVEKQWKLVFAVGARYPTAFAQWLQAMDLAVGPLLEVALLGDRRQGELGRMLAGFHQTLRPRAVLAVSPIPPKEGAPPLLDDRPMLAGKPTAYVCRGFICKKPVTTSEEFLALLTQ